MQLLLKMKMRAVCEQDEDDDDDDGNGCCYSRQTSSRGSGHERDERVGSRCGCCGMRTSDDGGGCCAALHRPDGLPSLCLTPYGFNVTSVKGC